MKDWPTYKMARDLADGKVFPVSEAIILKTAREHGIGRKMGRTVIFGPEDCERLYEVLPCPSGLSAARNHLIGSYAAPSAESALKKALELTTRKSPKKSGPDAKLNSLPNQYMAAKQQQHSRKRP